MVEHEDMEIAASLFIQAARDLDILIREHLKCQIAHDKTAVVASSDALLNMVTEALGPLAGKRVNCAPNLGIEWRAGRKRGRKKNTIRAERVSKCKERKKKVKTLRNLIGARVARHVCTAGVLPAVTYGMEVNGCTDDEWKVLRQVFGAATAPATSG